MKNRYTEIEDKRLGESHLTVLCGFCFSMLRPVAAKIGGDQNALVKLLSICFGQDGRRDPILQTQICVGATGLMV